MIHYCFQLTSIYEYIKCFLSSVCVEVTTVKVTMEIYFVVKSEERNLRWVRYLPYYDDGSFWFLGV